MTSDLGTAPLVRRARGDGPDPGGGRHDGDVLARLLHPVDPAEFVARYWCRRPVHLTGWADRHDGLFDLAALREALLRQDEAGLSVRVSRDRAGGPGGADRHLSIDAGQVADALRGGASICVDPIDRAVPRLRELAQALRRDLGHAGTVSVKCYLSPDGFGFNTHFDAHVVTTLQLAGAKRWRISRAPAVEHPRDNAFLDERGGLHYMHRLPSGLRPWERAVVHPSDQVDVVLEPGDVLCLPAGTWHDAKAIGTSLALNVAFEPADVLDLITGALRARLSEQARWRRGLPPRPDGGDPGLDLPEPAATLGDYLTELRRALDAPDLPGELARAWHEAVESGGSLVAGVAVAEPPAPAGRQERSLQCIVPVRDAAASARWYAQVLGLRPIATLPEYGWVELTAGVDGAVVGLTEVAVVPRHDLPRLGLAAPDLDRVRAAAQARGATVVEPGDVAGIARFLTVEDPDGNRISVFQTRPATGGAPDGREGE